MEKKVYIYIYIYNQKACHLYTTPWYLVPKIIKCRFLTLMNNDLGISGSKRLKCACFHASLLASIFTNMRALCHLTFSKNTPHKYINIMSLKVINTVTTGKKKSLIYLQTKEVPPRPNNMAR